MLALDEARRRWGAEGRVRDDGPDPTPRTLDSGLVLPRYSVGLAGLGGLFFRVRGQGATWEDAFAAADRAAAREGVRR